MKLISNNELVTYFEEFLQEESIEIRFAYSGILDVFDYCLSEVEAKKIIKPYQYHREHEIKFIHLFRSLFNVDYKCTINLREPLRKLNKHQQDRLNEHEIEIYNMVQSQKVKLLIADNENELDFFMKLSTQEIHFCDYIFDNENVIISGNYDLSFPMYYQDDKYKELVEMNHLHVRSW
ncbi:hypothetical protein [Paenibacillus marinisediminis]